MGTTSRASLPRPEAEAEVEAEEKKDAVLSGALKETAARVAPRIEPKEGHGKGMQRKIDLEASWVAMAGTMQSRQRKAIESHLNALAQRFATRFLGQKIDCRKWRVCVVCCVEQDSRGSMMKHVKEHGHAVIHVTRRGQVSMQSMHKALEFQLRDLVDALLLGPPPTDPCAGTSSTNGHATEPADPSTSTSSNTGDTAKPATTHASVDAWEVRVLNGLAGMPLPLSEWVLDSGESLLTIAVARYALLAPSMHIRVREALLAAIVVASTPVPLAAGGGGGQTESSTPAAFQLIRPPQHGNRPWSRAMWGLKEVQEECCSAVGIARTSRNEGLLKAVLAPTLSTEEWVSTFLRTTCQVCLDATAYCCGPSGSMHVLGCSHQACREGLGGWVAAQVMSEQRALGEVVCPVAGCGHALSSYELESCSEAAVAATAERLAVEKAVVKIPGWHWCPACESGGFATDEEEWMRAEKSEGGRVDGGVMAAEGRCMTLHCGDCGFEWCRRCRTAAAAHLPPPQSATGIAWLPCRQAKRELASTKWLSKHTKPCPSCCVATFRDGGCSHINCKICSFQWCWLCGGKYQPGRYTYSKNCPCKPEKQSSSAGTGSEDAGSGLVVGAAEEAQG